MRIGMLTGGGDCPGLNAVIRAVVRKGVGRLRPHDRRLPPRLARRDRGRVGAAHARRRPAGCSRAAARSSARRARIRTSPTTAPARVLATLARDGVDALIAIGGEDTLGVAHKLGGDGVQVVGVPKTIDNDLSATDFTFGFHTAVQIATDAIDRLHTTAESHDRVMVVEVMGRHAGWIATYSGLAGGADIILVPEKPFDIDEVCDRLTHRHARGANFSIVVVAEGATPVEGTMALQIGRDRRVRPRAPRRDRQPAAARDRAAHRLRGAHDAARPRAARRHARPRTTA